MTNIDILYIFTQFFFVLLYSLFDFGKSNARTVIVKYGLVMNPWTTGMLSLKQYRFNSSVVNAKK